MDIGGTGLKAGLVNDEGQLVSPRVRTAVTYPMCPTGEDGLVQRLALLAKELDSADRASVGFPGRVHRGVVLTGHKFTGGGPGSASDPELARQWKNFDLRVALSKALCLPVRVSNDADIQGLAVVPAGTPGFSVVITLGTGLGSALLQNGVLLPHMEFAHTPFRKSETYEQQLGEAARLAVGDARWNRRVREALVNFEALFAFDRLYLSGGNAKLVDPQIVSSYEGRVIVASNTAGITGGVRLWSMPEDMFQ